MDPFKRIKKLEADLKELQLLMDNQIKIVAKLTQELSTLKSKVS